MSDFLKVVKRLADTALDLYNHRKGDMVQVNRFELRDIVEDWRRLDSEYRSERMQTISIKAENEALRLAALKVIEMNRQHAEDQYGDAEKAESWSCVTVLRTAMSKEPKD